MDSTGSKEIAQQPFERNEILRLYISFLAVHAPCPRVGKWSEFLEEINRLCLLQEEKSKGSDDKDEEIKLLRGLLIETAVRANVVLPCEEEQLKWFDEQFIDQHDFYISLHEALMIDDEVTSTCKEYTAAKKILSALRSENERLKGERDEYRAALVNIKHSDFPSFSPKIAIKALDKYPNPTT